MNSGHREPGTAPRGAAGFPAVQLRLGERGAAGDWERRAPRRGRAAVAAPSPGVRDW